MSAEQSQQGFLWQAPALFRFDLGLSFCFVDSVGCTLPSSTSNSLHLLSLPAHLFSSPPSYLNAMFHLHSDKLFLV